MKEGRAPLGEGRGDVVMWRAPQTGYLAGSLQKPGKLGLRSTGPYSEDKNE